MADHGGHLHQQGRRRDARPRGGDAGRRAPRHVAGHLPRPRRPNAPTPRAPGGHEPHLLDPRRGAVPATGEAGGARRGSGPEAVAAQGAPSPHIRRQEPARRPHRLRARPRTRQRPLAPVCRPDVPRLPSRASRPERGGLRRPPGAAGPAAGEQRRAADGLPGAVRLHPGRRVPGHQPRPVPAAGAPRRASGQPHGGGRRRPEHLRLAGRRHPQHPRLREKLPGGQDREARAQLPLHGCDPLGRRRRDPAEPGPKAQDPAHGPRGGRAGHLSGSRRRGGRGRVDSDRDRAQDAGGPPA